MSIDAITTKFLDHCRAKGLSEHTLRAYRQDLGDLQRWSLRARRQELFRKEAVIDWMADLQERRLAPSSIKRRVACLKVLCRWLEDDGQIEENPFHHLRATVRLPRRLAVAKQSFGALARCMVGDQVNGGTRQIGVERWKLDFQF
ncbi:MAG: phage integrase N-terminal SAM-like domain-containing protein [Alphaproteobacteria bacterium]|nr:phage integrase N-terminal SAM-like domain-containing protein [Alphaproteobacteria bacterium]